MLALLITAMFFLVGLEIDSALVLDLCIIASCVIVIYYAIKFIIEDARL